MSIWHGMCFCDFAVDTEFYVVDIVEHLRQIDVEAIDYFSHHRSRCVDGNAIGVHDQLDVQRR